MILGMPVVWFVVGGFFGALIGAGIATVAKDGSNGVAGWLMEIGGYVLNQVIAALVVGGILVLWMRFS